MRPVCLFVFALCSSVAFGVRAEERKNSVSLSLEAALARAEEKSPIVRRAKGNLRVAESARVGAGLAMPTNPLLSFALGRRADRSSSAPAAEGFEWGLHLEQSFEIGGQRSARLSEAERGVDVAHAQARLAVAEARAEVRGAYVGSQLFRSQVETAKKREELAGRVLESARAKMGAGAASDVDVNLAESERGRAEHDRIEAEIDAAGEDEMLRLLLDFPEDTGLELTTPLGFPPLADDVRRLVEAAKKRRQDLRALRATESQLDAALTRYRREAIPNPTLFGDVSQAQPGQTFLGGGASMAVPVFRRNQGQIATLSAEKARIEDERRIADREVTLEVVRLHRALAQRRDEARVFAEDVVPAAEENLSLVTDGWHAGKFDLFRVVQAAREAGEARRRQLEVMAALWQVAIDLDRATGAP
ncbi:MAG TPA: TolC family protein [Polyangiaceae bacterium]|nr:TolC family protein [Polyangiaceae bacterium]